MSKLSFEGKSFHASRSSYILPFCRLLTATVVRRGISENMSEMSQLSILKDLTAACRASIGELLVVLID